MTSTPCIDRYTEVKIRQSELELYITWIKEVGEKTQ